MSLTTRCTHTQADREFCVSSLAGNNECVCCLVEYGRRYLKALVPPPGGPDSPDGHRSTGLGIREASLAVLARLNELSGRQFRCSAVTLRPIEQRLNNGATLDECLLVVQHQVKLWNVPPLPGQTDMRPYLRPQTLFRASNFEAYLADAKARPGAEPAQPRRRSVSVIQREIEAIRRQMQALTADLPATEFTASDRAKREVWRRSDKGARYRSLRQVKADLEKEMARG